MTREDLTTENTLIDSNGNLWMRRGGRIVDISVRWDGTVIPGDEWTRAEADFASGGLRPATLEEINREFMRA
jgi:hypothetical protein